VDIALADNTFVAVPFDTNDFDTGAIHSGSVNNTRFTAPTTGYYQLECTGLIFPAPVMTWTVGALATVVQAATDGFVVVNLLMPAGGVGQLNGLTDAANPPTIERCRIGSNVGGNAVEFDWSFTMPVKKGDYWKVTALTALALGATATVYFVGQAGGQRILAASKNGLSAGSPNIKGGTFIGPALSATYSQGVFFLTTVLLTAGDYIEFFAYQNSGASINLSGSSNYFGVRGSMYKLH